MTAKKPLSVPQAATVFMESKMGQKKSNKLSQILEQFWQRRTSRQRNPDL
jgi:hypothetical protein